MTRSWTGILLPFIGLAAIVVLLGMCAEGPMKRDVERTLYRLGYEAVEVEQSPAAWMCGKGRLVYRFRARRDGGRRSGHACAGGFIGVSVNEDAR